MADGGKVIIKIDGDDSSFRKVMGGLGKVGTTAIKGFATGAAAVTTAIVGIGAAAVKSYAEYEQLVGGVDTLFKSSSQTIQQYAANAYKTAGMSANTYMNTVTSFSASLINSVGGNTAKAAEMADMAVQDMSDNANKMGTNLETINQTYQSLARGNYAMLDNLKLGYGGTKTELERLLKEAERYKAAQGEIRDYSVDSFADIVEAIHVVQENMGITGTTAKEAASTIQGSFNTMKAAWENVLTGIADPNQDFDVLIDNLVTSIETFAENIAPRVEAAMKGVSKLFTKLAPELSKGLEKVIPEMINSISENLPDLADSAVSLISSFVNGISSNSSKISTAMLEVGQIILNGVIQIAPQLLSAGAQLIGELYTGIMTEMPVLGTIGTSISAAFGVNAIMPVVTTIINAFRSASAVVTSYSAAMSANAVIVANSQKISALLVMTMKPLEIAYGVLTGQITLATAAQVAFNAALNAIKAHPIMLAATALAALVGGIAAAVTAYDGYLEKNSELIQGVQTLGAETDKIVEKNNNLASSINNVKSSYDNAITSAEAQAVTSQKLADELFNLNEKESLTASEKERMANIISILNGRVDGLNLKLDEETGKLNMTKDAVSQLIAQKLELAKANAAAANYEQALQTQYEAEDALIATTQKLNEVQQKKNEILNDGIETTVYVSDGAKTITQYTREQHKAIDELTAQEKELIDSQETAKQTYEDAANAAEVAGDRLEGMGEATQQAASDVSSGAEQVGNAAESGIKQPVENAVDGAVEAAEEGAEKVKEAFSNIEVEVNPENPNFIGPLTDEMQKARDEFLKAGQEGVQGYAEGMSDTSAVTNAANGLEKAAVNALQIGTQEAQKLGQDFGQGYVNGIKAKEKEAYNAGYNLGLQAKQGTQDAQNSSSPSKEAAKLGNDYGQGYENGIKEKEKDTYIVGYGLGLEALKGTQEAQDSHSAAKESKYLGHDYGDGYALGIIEMQPEVKKAGEELAKSALEATEEAQKDIRYADVAGLIAEQIGSGFQEAAEDQKKYFDSYKKSFENALDFGVISEKEFYKLLEKLRDKYLANNTEEWYSATKEIFDYRKSSRLDEIEQTEEFYEKQLNLLQDYDRATANDEIKYYDDKIKRYEEYIAEIKNSEYLSQKEKLEIIKDFAEQIEEAEIDLYNARKTIIEDYISDVESTIDKQKTLYDKLKGGSFFYDVTIGGTDYSYTKLADPKQQIKVIEEYNDLLDKIRSKSDSPLFDEIMQSVLSEDVGTAINQMKAILAEADIEGYLSDLEKLYEMSANTAGEAYENEFDSAIGDIQNKFDEFGLTLSDDFFNIGKKSAEKFSDGFIEKLSQGVFDILSGIYSSSFVSGDGNSNNNNYLVDYNYEINISAGDVQSAYDIAMNAIEMDRMKVQQSSGSGTGRAVVH